MQIETSQKAFELLQTHFNPDCEEIWGIYLSSKLSLLGYRMIHRGTANFCNFHSRDLFREAIRLNSVFLILAHNHPSGSIEPSDSDLKLTKKVIASGRLLEIPVIDHLIFTQTSFFSFKDSQILFR